MVTSDAVKASPGAGTAARCVCCSAHLPVEEPHQPLRCHACSSDSKDARALRAPRPSLRCSPLSSVSVAVASQAACCNARADPRPRARVHRNEGATTIRNCREYDELQSALREALVQEGADCTQRRERTCRLGITCFDAAPRPVTETSATGTSASRDDGGGGTVRGGTTALR